MTRNALVLPKRKVISRSTLTNILPRNSKSPTDISRRKIHPSSKNKKHNTCFIYKKRGHFAINCPNKSAKVVRLIQRLQQSSMLSNHEDVESNFSEQTEQDGQTTFILAESTDDSDIEGIYVISTVQEISQARSNPTIPSVKISVLPSKFHKPIHVIGFLDTGAQRSMLNPYVFSSCWENHTEFFKAASYVLKTILSSIILFLSGRIVSSFISPSN